MDFLTFLKQKQNLTSAESAPTKTSFFSSPVLTGIAKKVPSWMESLGNSTINLTKSIFNDPVGTASKGVNAVGNFVGNSKTFQQMLDDQAKASQTWQTGDNIDVFAKPAAGFTKFLLKEIAAGTLSIGKSVDQASGFKGLRDKYGVVASDPEGKKAFEEKYLGREVKSLQDAYINPTLDFADRQGSGTLEKGLLGIGAGIGGFLVESPVGAPAKKKVLDPLIKSFAKQVVTDANLGRNEIEAGIREFGLTEDASRELTDSINIILDQKWQQGKKANEIQNLLDDMVRRSRAVESGPAKSVVQVAGKDGKNVFYEVSPEDLKVLSEDVIDGTKRGIAGKEINGDFYHLTAKTPQQMMESAGFKNGGKKTLDEIMQMITPKKRVAVRTEDGRFAGSFMDESPAFKVAAKGSIDEYDTILNRKSVTGEGEFDLTVPEAKALFRNLFTEKEIGFMIRDEIKGGKQMGNFSGGFRKMVEVVQKEGKVQSDTVYHEAFHGYFNTFIDEAQRRQILDSLKMSPATALSRGMKRLDGYKGADLRAEEWLADDFARYIREISAGKTPTSKFAELWQKMLRQIRQMIRKANHVDQLYRDIVARKRDTTVKNPSKRVYREKTSDAQKDESAPKISETQQKYEGILTHLAGAEKGYRFGVTDADGNYKGLRAAHSTFPQWLPDELRSRELFDKYMTDRTGSLDDFKIKYKEGSRLEKLDNAVRQRLYEETGEDLRLIPDDLAYIDELAQQYNNEIDKLTGESLRTDSNIPDPLVSGQKQEPQTGSQTPQLVSKGDSLPTVYPQEAKRAIVDIAQRNGETVKQVVQRFEGIKRLKTNILEYVQNTDERIKQLMERPDFTIVDSSNVYQKATLASGRMGARIEAMKDEAKNILEDIRDTAKVTGQEYDALKGEVDDYLIARHAPERNAAIGEKAAGMTTAEAEALKAKIESGPHGKDVVRLADAIQEMNNKTLDLLLKSQVITEDLHKLLRERYQYHVPLYRIQEAEGDIGGLLTGKGFDVRSTGIKRAKGSEKEIDDIIGNVVYNYEQAIIRSEKNTVDLATLQFVRDNKKALGGLMKEVQLPFVPVGTAVHKGQVFHEVMDKVNDLIVKYGYTPDRRLKTGQAFGYFEPSTKKVVTRFGTSKDTLIHEFGHMLDEKFGLSEGNEDFFTSDVKAELRSIADLRDSFDPAKVAQRTKSRQSYVRSSPEKIAEFISTYFSDLDTARRVAPIATRKFEKFLADKPELRELSDVMKSRARSGEIMQETIFAQQRFTNDPKILTLRENGKATYIKIEDPNLAIAIRGVGREKLGGILNAVRWFTNFYSGLHTRFNPDFALPNKVRDLQETITYLASQKDLKSSNVAKVALRDPKSLKDVTDFLRGKDTEGARLYKEMKEAGGTTGGMGLSTREQVGIDMDKLDKIANSVTRRTTEKMIEYVDNWNTIFEDSTRLTVYRTAREQGLSVDRAAFLAKEASINFNRMGKGGPVINAIWMFSNASIQGSTKMLRALKNPKVLAGVVATVGVSVAATNEWNDAVDPDWREKIPKWDRMNSLPIVLPTEEGEKFNYFVIPVSWGLKPIKVMTDYAYDAMSGHGSSAEEILKGTLTSIIEGYNPVGGTDLNSALMPTVLDTPYEIARNQKWSGSKITPTNYNNAPDDTLYFSSLPETTTGRASISLSELMAKGGIEVSPANIKYAYEQYVGGAGRFINRMFNTVAGAVEGKPVALDEYPFIARFYRERSNDELEYTKSTETDQLDSLMDEDARTKKKLNISAIQAKDEIMALGTSEEKKARLKEISAENPDLAKKVLDLIEDDKAGLTPQESQLKGATVKVRAEYIRKELEKLNTPEEKKAYLKDLQAKKILTASVLDELGL